MVEEVFGPYRIQELLGRGGMGEVHRAFDTAHDRVVALKRLGPAYHDDEDFRARFRREARIVARLREPHVIPIHAYGEIDGRLYLDMRLVEGEDLGKVLARGRMEPRRAARIVEQVASALDAAHADDLVHRDVKPSNILVAASDFVYLVDFGIARSSSPAATHLTASGDVVGTLDYMAPERFSADAVDGRVDVYALACVLYTAVTGLRPFEADGTAAQIWAHMQEPPPRPSTRNPAVPAALDEVVARGMAKSPDDRYRTAGALAEAVTAALESRPTPTRVDPAVHRTTLRHGLPPTPPGPTPPGPTPAAPPAGPVGTVPGTATPLAGGRPGDRSAVQPRQHPTGRPPAPSTPAGGQPMTVTRVPVSRPTGTQHPPAIRPPVSPAVPPVVHPGHPPVAGSANRAALVGAVVIALIVGVVAAILVWNKYQGGLASPTTGSVAVTTTGSGAGPTTTRSTTTTAGTTTTTPAGPTEPQRKLLDLLPPLYHGNSSCKPIETTELAAVDCPIANEGELFGIPPPTKGRFFLFPDRATQDAQFQKLVKDNNIPRDDDWGGCRPATQHIHYAGYWRNESGPREGDFTTCFVKDGFGQVWWVDTKTLTTGVLLSTTAITPEALEKLDAWWNTTVLTKLQD
ncbi:protein kinase [Actinosynnema sp. NPDC020468]|uniref:serine/threonine-protein kinase n=1 Tax=Actinosynnema sp. NPDC020468 TaxID=3154488 RepID=UPI00340E12D1